MARAKRIYELAKEFVRDEKEIIEFLTAQGIRVANRLSAVSEDTYNMLKVHFTEPPKVEEPEPEPPKVEEPEPEPPEVEQPKVEPTKVEPTESAPEEKVPAETAQPSKKKKKNKNPQQEQNEPQDQLMPPPPPMPVNKAVQEILNEATKAGNEFIGHYVPSDKRKTGAASTGMSANMDSWALLQSIKFENVDDSPARYWQAVNKLTTAAYKKSQSFGLANRELLSEMRETFKVVGADYVPREIFTDEENERFAKQQRFFFTTFSHGQGALNDNLLALKLYCERMNKKFEQADFVEYITNPGETLPLKPKVPFNSMAEVIVHSLRAFPRRVTFYSKFKTSIEFAIKNFFEWIDGYQKLKEAGADEPKLKKYLELEEKFMYLTEFMSFDNLLFIKKTKEFVPYLKVVELLNVYRDDLDNPEAEETFRYNLRGEVMNKLKKPKEFVFLWQLGNF